MSGGHWNYDEQRMESLLKEVARDPKVKQRFPLLAERINTLADALGRITHDLDWDLSDDCSIEDDAEFEAKALDSLRGSDE